MPGPTTPFPRRDRDGHVISMVEWLVAVLAGFLVSFLFLALLDGLLSLLGAGAFGAGSGWLATVLPVLLFIDDFRSWSDRGGVRWVIAAVTAIAAGGLGVLAAGLVNDLPALLSGAVGALIAVLGYGVVWFVSVRGLGEPPGGKGRA